MKIASPLIRLLSLAAVLAAAFPFAPEADARPQRVRMTTLAPRDSSFHKLLLQMKQEWKQATDGQVDLMVFPGGIQGGETSMIDRMRINQTQAALISGIGLSEIDQGVAGIQQVPMLFRTYDELAHVMDALGPQLSERVRDKGFVVLSWIDTGWVRIFSKSPLETPDDMRRGKLFTWSGDTAQTDLLRDMGFRPVPVDSTEVTSSLQTGLIDIVPLPPFFALASQSYKPAPHMLDIKYSPLVGAIVLSENTWKRIKPDHQKAMLEIADRIGREMTLAGREENEAAIKVMRDRWGLKVREPSQDALEAWYEESRQAYELIRDNTVPADIFDEVVRLLQEKRASDS